jgi:two-component system OmpR family response regulator
LVCVKILVMEDDKKLAGLVRKGLEAQGITVDFCADGDDAYALATTRSYDALVLDIMVPGRDGLSILRNLREQRINTPVVLVTARSALHEKLEGLNLGADDYLTKPFYVDELIARLHAVARRAAGGSQAILENGPVTVNLLTREVRRAGESVVLTSREFALLTYLMRSPGQTFTRAQICEHVWNYHFDPGTNLVDVYVQRLRRKLDADEADGLIETVRGVGYRVRAPGARGAA